MTPLLRFACIAVALSASLHARADSFASSASSAGSASSGSISDSLHHSSNSSSDGKVADRDFHVIDVAMVPEKAGVARITLQANDTAERVMLDVPQAVIDKERLHKGDAVHTQQRVYGIAFEHGDTHAAFFLALNDDWYDELSAHKVKG
ncbi:MAG TPA: hypothetical protein VIF60_16975 [Burkholderiaceae bacterium]